MSRTAVLKVCPVPSSSTILPPLNCSARVAPIVCVYVWSSLVPVQYAPVQSRSASLLMHVSCKHTVNCAEQNRTRTERAFSGRTTGWLQCCGQQHAESTLGPQLIHTCKRLAQAKYYMHLMNSSAHGHASTQGPMTLQCKCSCAQCELLGSRTVLADCLMRLDHTYPLTIHGLGTKTED